MQIYLQPIYKLFTNNLHNMKVGRFSSENRVKEDSARRTGKGLHVIEEELSQMNGRGIDW